MARGRLRLMFEDLQYALRARGDDVFELQTEAPDADDVIASLSRRSPDFVLSVNPIEGMSELCAEARIPYVVWEIDPQLWVPEPPSSAARPWVHLFTYRRKHVQRYLDAGFPHVAHLPLAAEPALRKQLDLTDAQRAKYGAAVSFVGSSLILESHERDIRRANAALKERLDTCATPGERHRWSRALQVLRDALAAQRTDEFHSVFVSRLESGWAVLGLTPELEVDGRLMDLRIVYGRMLGTRRRWAAVSSLGEYGMAVYGDVGWRRMLSPPVQYRGPANHALELNAIYNASRINLDVGRLYQTDIVTLRVFDILCCGAFPLVEHSTELADVLEPGREVVAYRNLRELREAAGYYLTHPAERRAISEAGRARVLGEHTVALRVQTMIDALCQRGALPR